MRNYISLYAIEQGLDLSIGSQEASLLDTRNNNEDADALAASFFDVEGEDDNTASAVDPLGDDALHLTSEAYQIWKNAIDADPALKQTIENLPPVILLDPRPHRGPRAAGGGAGVYENR